MGDSVDNVDNTSHVGAVLQMFPTHSCDMIMKTVGQNRSMLQLKYHSRGKSKKEKYELYDKMGRDGSFLGFECPIGLKDHHGYKVDNRL